MNDQILRPINRVLAAVLVFLALYILLLPLLPAMQWWAKHSVPVISTPQIRSIPIAVAEIPKENTLVIPALDLKEVIHEGQSEYTVNLGIWRRPQSSTPTGTSNMVLAGHRFTYKGSGVLYHLDKIKQNDQIIVYWQGKAYEYRVTTIREVPPTEVSVEQASTEPLLTIYTCTPLVTAKNRLVVQARLVEKS